jgi:1,4-dihydroxy-2-naphthoyl-CoA hydrolase
MLSCTGPLQPCYYGLEQVKWMSASAEAGNSRDTLQLDDLYALVPFAATLGMNLAEATPQRVAGTLDWAPERCTTGGAMHGGALMTLADIVGAVCAFLNLPDGASTVTVSSSTNFMRAVRDGRVTAIATPLHTGRTIIVVQTDLRDASNRLVAHVTQGQAVLTR